MQTILKPHETVALIQILNADRNISHEANLKSEFTCAYGKGYFKDVIFNSLQSAGGLMGEW